MKKQDLVIIGGGIMGLMTAYYASQAGKKVTILEKRTIGNKEAASFSLTRSMRSDYLDPTYASLAFEARQLWNELQSKSDKQFIVDCGCLNLGANKLNPNLEETYAMKAFRNMKSLNLAVKKLDKKTLTKKYPQIEADLGVLDLTGGFFYLPEVTKLMLKLLNDFTVKIIENFDIVEIKEKSNEVQIYSSNQIISSKKIIITAGLWTNDVLSLINDCKTRFPIIPDRPQQCQYFIPSNKQQFSSEKLPVFAYLDYGIYGHPIFKGKTKGVKIGFYNPPDFKGKKEKKISSINDFVKLCMPALVGSKVEDVTDADQCFYDLVEDDNFILGKLPIFNNIYVGCGWRGTGYKFAPLVGKILSQLAYQDDSSYDISKFSPSRFSANISIA